MHRYELPTPIELGANPEVAAVAMLHYAIDVTERSLATAYPELCEVDFSWQPPTAGSTLLAQTLLHHLALLSEFLRNYRTAVAAEAGPGRRPAGQQPDPF